MKSLYELGDTPPTGCVPEFMYAAVIRPERYGEPLHALKIETIPVPEPGPGQVLVWVLSAGVNYNNIWAGRGVPLDVIALRRRQGDTSNLHIGGTDGAGVVWQTGSAVTSVRVGDEVIVTGGQWDETAPDIRLGADPTTSTSMRAWGYEGNYGTFAQFALADEYQIHPRPTSLGWEDAGCFAATAGTVYRQLTGWPPNVVEPGDPVLIWGGAGGLGSMAIQLVRRFGGVPIAVTSDDARARVCRDSGAHGVINRSEFGHWGRLPDIEDQDAYRSWQRAVRKFQLAFWDCLGERRDPRIVLEHPGQDTLPTSLALCDRAGMVVTCGSTSGYNGDLDLRLLWMNQKRLQGSHMSNTRQMRAVIRLAGAGLLDPCRHQTFPFSAIGDAHQALLDGSGTGNIAVRVNLT